MNIEQERAAFEWWASDEGESPRATERAGGCYKLAQIQSYWMAWQARAALQAECEKLRRDAERIEWLEEQTKKSWTGISFDYHRYAEDGYVVNHGYRFMGRHFASGFEDSLRKAIDAAMETTK